jgi:hypothetical protein
MAGLSGRSAYATPYPFEPTGGVTIAATATTGTTALSGHGDQVVVTNTGTVWVHVAFGDSTITATAARCTIPPETQVVLTLPFVAGSNETQRASHVAVITASGTATVQVERGLGV